MQTFFLCWLTSITFTTTCNQKITNWGEISILKLWIGLCMVFNAIFNTISVISWWSVLLVEETEVPAENHWPATSHWQTLSHNVVSSAPRLSGVGTLVVIGTDCIGRYNSNYHTITITWSLLWGCKKVWLQDKILSWSNSLTSLTSNTASSKTTFSSWK